MRLAAGLLVLLGVAGCQTGGPASVSIEEAKRITATFDNQRMAVPPRTIADITAVLDEYRPSAERTAERIALADAAAPGGSAALADFYLTRSRAAAGVGRTQQRLADLQSAKLAAESTGGDVSPILNELVWAAANQGHFADAVGYAEERVRIDERAKKHGRMFRSYALLVQFNIALGRLDQAERALALADALHGAPYFTTAPPQAKLTWQSDIASMEAQILMAKGRYREAETRLRAAVAKRQESDRIVAANATTTALPSEDVNDLITLLAVALRQQGKLIEAEVEARRALASTLKNRGRYNFPTAVRVERLSWILLDEGRATDAEQMARATLDILDTVGAKKSWTGAETHLALGSALVARGHADDALANYDAMMAALADDAAGRVRFGFGDLDWVTALVQTGRAQAALAMVDRQLERRRQVLGDGHYRTAEALAYRGMVLSVQGKQADALRAFHDAMPILLDATLRTDEDGQTAQVQRLRRVLDAYIGLLAQIRGTPIEATMGLDASAEAFRLADVARGRSVQVALSAAGARARLTDPALADLARREQDAGQEIAGLEATLVAAMSVPSEQQDARAVQGLRERIALLQQARTSLRQEIIGRFPDYAALVSGRPTTIDDARRALQPGEALVASYTVEDVTYVWAFGRRGPVAFAAAPLGVAQLDAAVTALRRALDPQARTLGDIPAFDVGLANRLYDTLLRPVEAGWRDAAGLVAVPDKALAQLPLGVLVTRPSPLAPDRDLLFASYRSVPFLARQVAITQLPSVAALPSLRAQPAPPTDRKPFIGFGDPAFSVQQLAEATPAATPSGGLMMRGGDHLRFRNAAKTEKLASADLADLPRLPDTADEVREIARALRADPNKDVFVGAAANEQTVKTMNLSDRRVIAFATHGLVPGDLDGLTEPALALSAPRVSGAGGDGLLTMDEVLGLKLNADWVVLSACNTAAGAGAGAEAISGLGRAFFYAGARALLVSNWPVETVSARALTTDLFRRQADNPELTRAEALRQTELALIDGGGLVDAVSGKVAFSYAHPIFWAPFSLIGDGGGVTPR